NMGIISVVVSRERRGWVDIIFEHVELLTRCVVGNGGASAVINLARPEVVLRASRLIESVILTRPSEDNRSADDGRNGESAELASLCPKHRSAHLPER